MISILIQQRGRGRDGKRFSSAYQQRRNNQCVAVFYFDTSICASEASEGASRLVQSGGVETQTYT